MYMEHCAAAAHLSKGRDAAGCGRPCTRRTGQGAATASRLELVDRVGAEHPLITDARCGSTLFSSHVQSALESLPEMFEFGVRHFRVELLRESAIEAATLVGLYADVLAGGLDPSDALAELESLTPQGVKRGTWDFE
jgi:putative protease